jgi:predicted dehydrogenase
MKILIIGGGSIGQRHFKNLIELGVREIGVLDINQEKLKELEKRYRVKIYRDLTLALKENWDAVFICTPPSSHIEIALKVADKKTPIFIEKPLSNNLKGTQLLIKKIKKYKIPVMLGYNLRFHPQLQEIKAILKENILGKIWGVRAEFGQYLPDWHPWEDYRRGYSAQKKFGGGVILDCIHEIDYLCWLFGRVVRLFAFARKISNLKIDTEDYAEITLLFKNNIVGQIHMDYLQRVYSRYFKIIGERGTLYWDLKKGELKYFLIKDNKWHVSLLKNFDFNQTYLEEVKYFLNCIKNKKMPQPDINVGYQTLKIALDIKKAAGLK